MLVSFMDGGRHPDIARKAGNEPLASDDEDAGDSVKGTVSIPSITASYMDDSHSRKIPVCRRI